MGILETYTIDVTQNILYVLIVIERGRKREIFSLIFSEMTEMFENTHFIYLYTYLLYFYFNLYIFYGDLFIRYKN